MQPTSCRVATIATALSRTGAVLLSFLLTAPGSAVAQLDKAERSCVTATHKAFSLVAKAESKLLVSCISGALKGQVADVDACVADDAGAKVAAAETKGKALAAAACGTLPSFGPSDGTGQTAVDTARAGHDSLFRDVFGGTLDAAIADIADRDATKCQKAATKVLAKCTKTYLKSYVKCASKGLGDQIVDGDGLGACRADDPRGKLAKRCIEKASDKLSKSCGSQDMDAIWPGCACQDPDECLRVAVYNGLAADLATVDNLPDAAVEVPVLRTPQEKVNSAEPGGEPWLRPEDGQQYVASLIVAREPDSALACSLGAMNVQTVLDANADFDYNLGILPLLNEVGATLLYNGHGATDLVGGGVPELLQQHAMPLYPTAGSFLQLATMRETHPLVPLKYAAVGGTVRFALQECLHDCLALETADPDGFPPLVFPGRVLVVHVDADRATVDGAIPLLAAEADATSGVTLAWVGWSAGDLRLELVDGTLVPPFVDLPADASVVYALDEGVDPVADVLPLPQFSAFLSAVDAATVVGFD